MDLSRQRSRRLGGPNPSSIQGAQGCMRRSGHATTPQVHAPVEFTAHEWRSKSGAARPPSKTDTQASPGRENDTAGWPAGLQVPRHASIRVGRCQRRMSRLLF